MADPFAKLGDLAAVADDPSCPYVTTSAEGTAFCMLAADETARLDAEFAVAAERWHDAEGELRLRLRAQAAVIARMNDGWDYVRPASAHQSKGIWFRVQDGAGEWVLPEGAAAIPQEPMTEDEKRVVYGRPVTEGADTDG